MLDYFQKFFPEQIFEISQQLRPRRSLTTGTTQIASADQLNRRVKERNGDEDDYEADDGAKDIYEVDGGCRCVIGSRWSSQG